jgi:hypothetical protein
MVASENATGKLHGGVQNLTLKIPVVISDGLKALSCQNLAGRIASSIFLS